MYLNVRNILTFSVLSAAAALSWYFSRIGTVEEDSEAFRERLPLGYYLTDAEISGTDEEGRLLYKIWAGRAEERPNQNQNQLFFSDVRVEYRPAEDTPWHLSAESGETPADVSYIDLSGSVELASEPDNDGERTIILTEALRFEPEELVASTDEIVSLFVGTRRLDAVGIRVFLRDDRLELQSSVHGEFIP